MGERKVVDLDKARERRLKKAAGPVCPKCGSGGITVWAHRVHCSDWSTEEKVEAMTGHYGLDEEAARKTVERWEEGKGELIDLPPH